MTITIKTRLITITIRTTEINKNNKNNNIIKTTILSVTTTIITITMTSTKKANPILEMSGLWTRVILRLLSLSFCFQNYVDK